MLKFSLKYMRIRLGKHILTGISIVIALTVSLMAYNIANQVKDGVVNAYQYYDTIIGPSGNQTQLVLNTLFYTDKPLGLVPYGEYEKLRSDRRVAAAIPFGEGDNYNNARIVGTGPDYLASFHIAQGRLFSGNREAVIGYQAARDAGLRLGDVFFSVHGLTTDVNSHAHDDESGRYTVAGILSKTNTAADNVIFTDIASVWETHGAALHDGDSRADEGVTAVLIRCTSVAAQMSLSAEYNQKSGMQAVNPAAVMRELMRNIDLTKNIVYLLCGIILVMNLFVVCVITMLNMYDIKKDIGLFRLIGVPQRRIEAVVYLQSLAVSTAAVLAGFLLSRICMALAGRVTASMGIVLDGGKLYSPEFAILFAVVFMAFVPVLVAVKKTLRGGVIDER